MKCIVVDLYEISDEFMKEHELNYKNRITIYNCDIKKIEDFAIDTKWKDKFKVGQVIDNWQVYMSKVI